MTIKSDQCYPKDLRMHWSNPDITRVKLILIHLSESIQFY